MIRLEIVNKNNYEYNLKDNSGNNYILNLDFFNIKEKPKIRDYIYMCAELLNPEYDGYNTSYTFGSLENKYGKESIAIDDVDVIKVVIDKKEIYLKRLYG